MRSPLLVLNAGSSSVKFSMFDASLDRTLRVGIHGQIEGIGGSLSLRATDGDGRLLEARRVPGSDQEAAIVGLHEWFKDHVGTENSFAGVGHRVVHGGHKYVAPCLVDDALLADLEDLVPLAPLHQPHNISAIRTLRAVAPKVPQVACFDTSFHAVQAPVATRFALPRALSDKGIRRYGFHGLSYEYIVSVLPQLAPACANGRLIVAHLGNGASMCAINEGRSVATTMGFTPVDGLPMGTRTGTLDPGVILYLLKREGMTADAVERVIYERSGLLGVSGLSSDMRALLASDDPRANEAVELFAYRIGREMGSLAAALKGVDAVIFTGGIGENAAVIRSRVCRDAEWLGLDFDESANEHHGPLISTALSRVSAWIIPTDENLMIARHTRNLLEL
jgi:acetate kinase